MTALGGPGQSWSCLNIATIVIQAFPQKLKFYLIRLFILFNGLCTEFYSAHTYRFIDIKTIHNKGKHDHLGVYKNI